MSCVNGFTAAATRDLLQAAGVSTSILWRSADKNNTVVQALCIHPSIANFVSESNRAKE
jgi:hypothetical protein